MSILKQYENETGKKATRKKGYEYQYTFKYVAWLENNIQSDKALLKRCLPTISYMADVSDEVAKLLVDIQEAIK